MGVGLGTIAGVGLAQARHSFVQALLLPALGWCTSGLVRRGKPLPCRRFYDLLWLRLDCGGWLLPTTEPT
jgi:hypothetical protein